MRSFHPLYKQIFGQYCGVDADNADDCQLHWQHLGLSKLESIIDGLDKEYMETSQVLCHNDTKQFNILVEPCLENGDFGPNANFVLCDWEMTIKGRNSKDAGIFLAWPIACACYHAAQGHKNEAHHLLESNGTFWDEYEKAL